MVEDELDVASPTAATASYDLNGGTSYAALGLSIEPGPTDTTTTLSASDSSPAPGQTVTFTALVQPQAPAEGTPTGTVTFSEGSTDLGTATLQNGVARVTLDDGLDLGTYTITAAYSGDPYFFTGSQGDVTLDVEDPADDVSSSQCNCGCPNEPGSLVGEPANQNAPAPDELTYAPVRYADGVVTIAETDLHSDGFGFPWGQTRSWTNGGGYSNGLNGNGWVDTYTPTQLIRADGSTTNSLIVAANGTTAYYFNLVNGVYQPSNGEQSQLSYNSNNDTYTLIDGMGDQIVFDGFGSTWLPAQRGQFASYTNADGVTMTASDNSSGQIAQLQRTAGGVSQTWMYSYLPSTDRNAGLLSNVQLLDNSGSIVRQVQYAYYDGTQSGGSLGDLMTATVEDASGNAISTNYYRYYTAGEANGYTHALKYVLNGDSYLRLAAVYGAGAIPGLSDATIAPYADNYFQYDSSHRVTEEVAAAGGASNGTSWNGGLGTSTFSYTPSTNAPGYNSWAMKTTVTNPDGSTDTVYTNAYAQVMLDDHYDPTSSSDTDNFYAYNNNGQLILTAEPSAISGYSDSNADLLNNVNGSYQYLKNSSGLITRYDYYTSTTAGETTAGGVANYLQDEQIQQGQQGTLIPQETWQYYAHIVNGQTIAPIAADTVYRNDDGTGGETTIYSYTWYANTAQIQSETDTAPVISAAENGPGTPDVTTTFYDAYGNVQWVKDPSGFIHYYAYDTATGAQVEQIVDVDTNKTGEFTNLPSGWTTPNWGPGGNNLVTTDKVDALGRTTEEISPGGNITYYVYLDTEHEERIYQGWNGTTATLPTEVIRDDAADGYTETLTMTATPNVTDGTPDGTEAISNLFSLTRDYTNDAGQVTSEEDYFNLHLSAYTTGQIGTLNYAYYQTDYAYDSGGRLYQTTTGNGTIYQTIFNSLGEAISDWVGTSTSNLVQTAAYSYDADGNLIQETDMPGLGAANRVTDYWYDWRDRLVAQKSGVESSENDGVNRPIIVTTYDNLDEVTETQQYVGDGVTPQIVNGVLQALPSSDLRAQEVDKYDDQGRVYQTLVYDVNPSTGAVGSALTSNFYYDHRGNLMAESDPGGLWTKTYLDGAGRAYEVFTTDGASGTNWYSAADVTNDHVLEQEQSVYDADNNVIETIESQRFHNTSGVGHLGTPTSPTDAARVYYAANYYDNADRLIASVNAGTNGGTAWTRPDSVPASSPTLLVTQYQYQYIDYGLVTYTIDPTGIVTQTFYDNLGRHDLTVQDYTGAPQGDANDVHTYYYDDGDNNPTYVRAQETGDVYQWTQYVYGATTAAGDGVNSNDMQTAIEYPDPTTGQPSASQEDKYLVNALGDVVQSTDRNGTVHQYTYDVLGRLTSDAVTTLGANVDGSVRRIDYAYDSQGNLSLITSYDAATGGNIVNQVQRVYNGLGQLTGEYQSHSGPVVQGYTPEVQYAYNEMQNGENNSRLTSIIYPVNGSVYYNYNSGLDDRISRLSSLSGSVYVLESYVYLGLDTVVERDHPQISVNQTLIAQNGQTGDGGDQYVGLDRFGRVVNDNWVNTTTGQSTDDFNYGYDQDSNLLYKQNLVDAAMSELYQYNSLDELISFARGTLNATHDGIVGTPSASQSWTPDALGNFTSVTTNGSAQSSTFNQQNQITGMSGAGTISYDNNGNLTADGSGNTYVYDAWNELVAVKNSSGVPIASYTYDGLGRRVSVTEGGTTTDLYYSSSGQVLEEDVNGMVQAQNVWSAVYVNALVLRDQSSQHNGVLDQRLYIQQDANWNVTALVDTTGNVVERYDYLPYGSVTVLSPSWTPIVESAYNVPVGFQGMGYDWTVGMNFSQSRVYDPVLGRWVQTDPLGLAPDNNDYRMEGNGPTHSVDPSGLDQFWIYDPIRAFQDIWNGLRDNRGQGLDLQLNVLQSAREAGIEPPTDENGKILVPPLPEPAGGSVYPTPDALFKGITGFMRWTGYDEEQIQKFDIFMNGPVADPSNYGPDGEYFGPLYGTFPLIGGGVGRGPLGKGGRCPPKAGAQTPRTQPRGGTYVLRDPVTGKVMRSGRTKNLAVRRSQHARDPKLEHLKFEEACRTDVLEEQRGLEQLLHDKYNPPLNKIRPIRLDNPRLGEYLDAANGFIRRLEGGESLDAANEFIRRLGGGD